MCQNRSDVVSAGADGGNEGVAYSAFQQASRQAAVDFHVTDLSFYGSSAADVCDEFCGQASSGAADKHSGLCFAVAAIAAVDDGPIGALISKDRHLLQFSLKGMAVLGVARKAAHADHKALVQRGGHTDLAAEFIPNPGLVFGDAN